MTKAEFVAAVADKTGFTKKDSDAAIKAVFDTLTETMKNGDKLTLVGFGTFGVKERAARNGVNPLTKKPVKIKACKVPYFKAGKTLKDDVQ